MEHFFVRNMKIPLVVCLILVAGVVHAGVDLRWSPNDTTVIAPAATSRLSIHIDEPISFRTIEVTVNYDATVVRSLGGGSGSLYSESGHLLIQDFEETPGSWHGYAVVMDAGEYITGPGELLYWDIEGLAAGICPVHVVEVRLFDEQQPPNIIPDVYLSDAIIMVGDPLSSALDELPGAGYQLQISPNPFNPRTRISFDVDQEARARLSVFDLRGRQIMNLFDGPVQAGTLSVDWNGTDDLGRLQPGGTYIFQLETNTGTIRAKGILVK